MKKNSAKLHLPSLLKNTAFLLILLGLSISPAFAACHVVTPSGSGAQTGADWNNAIAGLPSSYTRGDIYYFADGNYGNSLNLTQADSGTSTIELRKAQSYDNCTSTGWNTSTMGSGQMLIQSTGSGTLVNISSDYWIINGNGQNAGTTEIGCGGVEANPPSTMTGAAPKPAACGIKIDDSTCTSNALNGCQSAGVMHGGGNNITWESAEWFGHPSSLSEPYFWFAGGGNLANVVITHSYLHNAGAVYFVVVSGGWDNGSFDHNYVWGLTFQSGGNHPEAVQLQGSNGQTTPDNIHHNIFRDQVTDGDVVTTDTGGIDTFNFYDNADICSAGATSGTCDHFDGAVSCFHSPCTAQVYNNTFAYPTVVSGSYNQCGFNVSGGASTITWKNNLFYNCNNILMTGGSGGTTTMDYNSYLNSSQSAVGSHDVSVSSGAPNPFSNLTGGSVALASDNADWNNRVSLGAPFDTLDLYGNALTTNRGAAQFGATNKLGVPTNFGGTPTPQ